MDQWKSRNANFYVLTAIFVLLLTGSLSAQSQEELLFKDFQWRGIGLAHVGRVTDIDALEDDFATVLVAAASGGVWKSTNAGTTWEQIFAGYGSSSIGDVAFFQKDPNIIWVGTGESCTRNSVAWGDGIYKSIDGGLTFQNMGLRESKHISEVVTHPNNPDIVYVAAQGHLWGHGGDQGIFKTTDGGLTWEKMTNGVPDDGRTGASDLKMDPDNPNILYAGYWERMRQPHRFDSGGPNGGIYKTTNGGRSWNKLTNGLPEGDTGKIGIAIYKEDPGIVMAIVEAEQAEDRADLSTPKSGIYRSENGGGSWEYISSMNNRPFYYSHIYISPVDDNTVYVLDGSGRISEDGGKTFPRSMPGISGDFHALWLDPNNMNRFYVGNDKGSYITHDHGLTFTMFDDMDISQFYAVNVDMRDPYFVYGGLQDNGNWGGPSNSRDVNGILNDHWFKFHSGDGFHTTPDPNDWRTVYTESQGGRISRFDAVYRQVGRQISPNRQNVLNFDEYITQDYLQRQIENGWSSGGRGGGTPTATPFRFNWSAPFILSPHNSKTIYFGSNFLFKSVNRGDTWNIISPDLSKAVRINRESGGLTRDVTSAEHHASLITISESPITPGIIWVGTDDGNVQITRNDGKIWTNVRGNIPDVPEDLWVSRVEASHFDEATAYVSFDGHRSDNYDPWIYRTTDYGRTWSAVMSNIPNGQVVYVVKEDLKNQNLLFAGTEGTVFASVNGGESWERLMNDMPTAAIHDLVIHPREHDIIVA
ncbi:hypothetical protein IIB79_11665, partial [candidate division KSB1 bacterium]|nr:hypothetical protein [candidate division KSB1 bacterium]